MAEERLIDDDKDRKYKIRINEDGEEELIIAPQTAAEEAAEIDFEVPDFDDDDEEAAVMTPEQLAARQRQREEEAARRAKKVAAYVQRAKACLEEEDFSGASYALNEAGELDKENGEIYALKIKVYTKYFSDWSFIDDCAEAADGLAEYASDGLKQDLKAISAPLTQRISQTEASAAQLNEENECRKAERRASFAARKKTSLTAFCACAAPFVLFTVLAIVFGVRFMYTREDALFTIITIVCASLALVAFVAMLFLAHRLWDASRNVRLNERNSSTRLGREYEEQSAHLRQLTRIYAAINSISAPLEAPAQAPADSNADNAEDKA